MQLHTLHDVLLLFCSTLLPGAKQKKPTLTAQQPQPVVQMETKNSCIMKNDDALPSRHCGLTLTLSVSDSLPPPFTQCQPHSFLLLSPQPPPFLSFCRLFIHSSLCSKQLPKDKCFPPCKPLRPMTWLPLIGHTFHLSFVYPTQLSFTCLCQHD